MVEKEETEQVERSTVCPAVSEGTDTITALVITELVGESTAQRHLFTVPHCVSKQLPTPGQLLP